MASGGNLTEAHARAAIVRYCALLWERRLVTGTSGNVSVRLDDGDLLVTPTLRSLRALSEDELIRTDAAGEPRRGRGRPTAELPLHVAAYRSREDVHALVHTHPTFCVVCSKLGRVFDRDTVGARETLGELAWTPYHPAGSAQLAQVTARAFAGGAQVVIMERHGISAAAPGLEQAFNFTDLAEEAARIAFFSNFL